MKERKIRVGPWDCEEKLLDRVTLYRARQGGKPWTWVLHKALHELMDREQVFIDAHATHMERPQNPELVSIGAAVVPASVVPAVGVPAVGVPASVVPASVVPASVVPASVVPASVVPAVELSPNAKRLVNLKAGLARKQATLAAAYEELKTDPASLRANNLVKRIPDDIADSERLILEVGALVEAEEAAEETTGGVAPGEEV